MTRGFFAATGVCLLAVVLLMSGSGFHTPRIGDLLMQVFTRNPLGHRAVARFHQRQYEQLAGPVDEAPHQLLRRREGPV